MIHLSLTVQDGPAMLNLLNLHGVGYIFFKASGLTSPSPPKKGYVRPKKEIFDNNIKHNSHKVFIKVEV